MAITKGLVLPGHSGKVLMALIKGLLDPGIVVRYTGRFTRTENGVYCKVLTISSATLTIPNNTSPVVTVGTMIEFFILAHQ